MRAKFSSVSVSGIAEARPGVLVSTTDWASPGKVSSAPRAAAAAAKLGTPGVIVTGICSARRRRSCSPIADQTDRSPECRRATSWPASVAALHSAMMASRSRGAVLMIRAPAGQWLRISSGIREPAYRQTGQPAIRFRPRKVSRSAAPGPAPIKCTVICVLLQPRHKQPVHHLRFVLHIPVWQGL